MRKTHEPLRMKRSLKTIAYVLLLLVLVNCQSATPENTQIKTEATVMKAENIRDPHSFSRPEEAVITHIDLELKVDFTEKVLSGTAQLKIKNHNSSRLYLDTKGLSIQKVSIGDREVAFKLHQEIEHLGSALEIEIDQYTTSLTVHYKTSPKAEALQWLSPEQTEGKNRPFLFTQSQAILARSWVPCQDSPGIRFTYRAIITVPNGLMALMSAENPQKISSNGTYTFQMQQPIPSYLLALTVGELSFKPITANIGIYAEPIMLERAAYEFAHVGDMMQAAEKLYGTYQWGRYDMVVLPPSFPFGGMENPRLTFATPTIIAGDRSLTSLIAHELAHSWSGNLVTNATWNDFWLNEGFTVYFELRIMEEVYGKDFSDMLALISYRELKEELEGLNYNDDTRLKLDLNGRNPDDGVTAIAYEKGFYFLKLIEETVGREKWDAFVKGYFEKHSFQVMTTEQFIAYLRSDLLQNVPESESTINIDKWVYGKGLPDNCPIVMSERFENAEQQANAFIKGTPASELKIDDFSWQQWVHFLALLPQQLTLKQMVELDQTFNFTQSGNSEILFEWLKLVIKNKYEVAYPKLATFLHSVGRRKFIAPLYAELISNPDLIKMGKRLYNQSRPNYHFVATNTIDKMFEDVIE